MYSQRVCAYSRCLFSDPWLIKRSLSHVFSRPLLLASIAHMALMIYFQYRPFGTKAAFSSFCYAPSSRTRDWLRLVVSQWGRGRGCLCLPSWSPMADEKIEWTKTAFAFKWMSQCGQKLFRYMSTLGFIPNILGLWTKKERGEVLVEVRRDDHYYKNFSKYEA